MRPDAVFPEGEGGTIAGGGGSVDGMTAVRSDSRTRLLRCGAFICSGKAEPCIEAHTAHPATQSNQ